MRQIMLLVALILASPVWADSKEEGFVPLFNGKDLSGWVNVNGHPSTFFVKDGMIITTGKPTGFMRTEKQYENFILEMEWFHVNTKEVGNSGLFVWGDPLPAAGTPYTRGIEVQVLVNLNVKDTYTSHGDLFSIWGAKCKPDRPHPKGWERCLPSELLCKGGGEWNHYRVEAKNGAIKLQVNGKEVSGVSECNPRKGYLALESEGAECRFRNIKIKELPSTDPKPNEIADVAKGHQAIYNGLDLDGLQLSEGHGWKANVGSLSYSGKGSSELFSKTEVVSPELIADFQFSSKTDSKAALFHLGGLVVKITPTGDLVVTNGGKEVPLGRIEKFAVKTGGGWNRAIIRTEKEKLTVIVNGVTIFADKTLEGLNASGKIGFSAEGPLGLLHPYVRSVK